MIPYNRKLVGARGEIYRHSKDQLAFYTLSKRLGQSLIRKFKCTLRQIGDWEITASFDEKLLPQIARGLKIKDLATLHLD